MQVVWLQLSASVVAIFACAQCAGQSPQMQNDRTQAIGTAEPQPVWIMQDSGVSSVLRGIFAVSEKVAWASGTSGIILRTIDGGEHWIRCAVPDEGTDGAKLDFRGIQAWDAQSAVVMSSGPGSLSRVYKTTDGCLHWRLILYNQEKDGFWDAIHVEGSWIWVLGDPVNGKFWLIKTRDGGGHWDKQISDGLRVKANAQSVFAASNSSLALLGGFEVFGVGGSDGAAVYALANSIICVDACSPKDSNFDGRFDSWQRHPVPIGGSNDSSGVFAIGSRPVHGFEFMADQRLVIVGGDYKKPNESSGTAAWSAFGAGDWTASEKPPHGYRSTVQWSGSLRAWITAGPNGSDISRDDGRTWQPLDDGSWNAISLPFIVGPNGRIARLNPALR